MCHQCQRNDKCRVVFCEKCGTKRYCTPCITNWYGSGLNKVYICHTVLLISSIPLSSSDKVCVNHTGTLS
jgi:hypothetical protein